jgi:L-ornithine N5-monooxygenase
LRSVNGIFNPAFVDDLFARDPNYRKALMRDARATNYGVVRLGLIEKLFDLMYEQRRTLGHDESKWPHRILGQTDITGVDQISQEKLRLNVRSLHGYEGNDDVKAIAAINTARAGTQAFEVDLIVSCTGYQRREHLSLLDGVADLLPAKSDEVQDAKSKIGRKVVEVGRNYGVKFTPGKVAPGSGVWLQGCNEATHGVSSAVQL